MHLDIELRDAQTSDSDFSKYGNTSLVDQDGDESLKQRRNMNDETSIDVVPVIILFGLSHLGAAQEVELPKPQFSIYVILVALLTLAQVGLSQEVPKPETEFSIEISMPQDVRKSGRPMLLKVKIVNTCDHNIYVGRGLLMGGTLLHGSDLHVLDSRGKPVPETERGMRLHGTHPKVPKIVSGLSAPPLKPGESVEQEEDLNEQFDLQKPGNYTVQSERFVRRTVLIKSNIISFTVVE